ncbi:hypothetical protein SHIRM173S_02885 [Streptomyces hirsutus]
MADRTQCRRLPGRAAAGRLPHPPDRQQKLGRESYEQKFLPKIGPWGLYGLLFTIVILFALQGKTITSQPLDVARIALPLLVYFTVMWFGTFLLGKAIGLYYERTTTLAFTAAGNNFELAIAVAIATFGVTSGQALSGVVGPLIEAPILVGLVYVSLAWRKKFAPVRTDHRRRTPRAHRPETRACDVVVIGGGQAGLAAGYHLRRLGADFVILDAQSGAGRRLAAHLGVPAPVLSGRILLPAGRPMPLQAGETYPDARHVIGYLTGYEQRYELPVHRPVRVLGVHRDGTYLRVDTDSGIWRARTVVSATGTWWRPFLPTVVGRSDFRGRQAAHRRLPQPARLRRTACRGGRRRQLRRADRRRPRPRHRAHLGDPASAPLPRRRHRRPRPVRRGHRPPPGPRRGAHRHRWCRLAGGHRRRAARP